LKKNTFMIMLIASKHILSASLMKSITLSSPSSNGFTTLQKKSNYSITSLV